MPDYQKAGMAGSETGENGAVALYKPPNMMAGATQNSAG